MNFVVYDRDTNLYLTLESDLSRAMGWVNNVGHATWFDRYDSSQAARLHGGEPIKIETSDSIEWAVGVHDVRFWLR
jgi:hypothetical protein